VSRRIDSVSRDADGFKPYTILRRERKPRIHFTKADLEKESKDKDELDRKWEEEERKLREEG